MGMIEHMVIYGLSLYRYNCHIKMCQYSQVINISSIDLHYWLSVHNDDLFQCVVIMNCSTGNLLFIKMINIQVLSKYMRFALDLWGHLWYTSSALDCWSTGRVSDPAPGA